MPEYFPTLTSGKIDWNSFSAAYLKDPTIRSGTQDGTPLARPGPECLLRTWKYKIFALTAADAATLNAWQAGTVYIGGVPFEWTDPRTGGSTWTVRLGGLIVLSPTQNKVNYYDAEIYLIEEPN